MGPRAHFGANILMKLAVYSLLLDNDTLLISSAIAGNPRLLVHSRVSRLFVVSGFVQGFTVLADIFWRK